MRYELIGYGVYDFAIAQEQDRHIEELAAMKLLTKEIRGKLPPLYSQEKVQDPIVQVKFFTPDSNWTWYGIEFDGKDLFFGWVVGLEKEMGYFSLKELESARGPLGLAIERDKWFTPLRLSEVKKLHQGAGVRTNPGELVKFIKVKEAEMEQRREYEIRMLTASELRQVADIMDSPALPEGTEYNPDMLIRPKMFTAPSGKVTLEVFFAKTGPKTIQQLLQKQTLLEQHQKDRPQDIIFFKDTIMKHYYPKEDFHPDSFRVVKPEPGVMVTLGCLKEHKWYPEKLECVPTQTLHRTIVPRTEKYIKEAEEWEAVGVPAQHRETEVGIVPRELVEVIRDSSTPITQRSTVVCPCKNGLEPHKMSPEAIQDELNALLYDEAVREACGAEDRELLSIIIAQPKAHHFDFLTGKTEWKVRGKWKKDEGFDIERNAQLDVEFKDAPDECVGKRIINLLKAYNAKVVGEELLYARTIPIEEGTL
ncbi:hypothetical protein ES705_21959 [subsurface metagenome]